MDPREGVHASNDVSYASGTAEGTGADFSDEELRQEFLQRRRELRERRRRRPDGTPRRSIVHQHPGNENSPQPISEGHPPDSVQRTPPQEEVPGERRDVAPAPASLAVTGADPRLPLEVAEGGRLVSSFDISRAGTMFSDVVPIDTPMARASATGQFGVTPNPFELDVPVLLVQGERQGRPVLIESVFAPAMAGMALFASALSSGGASSVGSATNGVLDLAGHCHPPEALTSPSGVAADLTEPPVSREDSLPPEDNDDSSPSETDTSCLSDSFQGRPRQRRKWVSCQHPLHCLSLPVPKPRPNSASRITGRPPFTVPKSNHRSSSVSSRAAIDLDDDRFFVKVPERSVASSPAKPLYSLRPPPRAATLIPRTPPRPVRGSGQPVASPAAGPAMDYLEKARHNVLKATYGPKVMDIILKHCERDNELAVAPRLSG